MTDIYEIVSGLPPVYVWYLRAGILHMILPGILVYKHVGTRGAESGTSLRLDTIVCANR